MKQLSLDIILSITIKDHIKDFICVDDEVITNICFNALESAKTPGFDVKIDYDKAIAEISDEVLLLLKKFSYDSHLTFFDLYDILFNRVLREVLNN